MRINPLQTHNQNVNQGGNKKIAGVKLPNFTQSKPKLSDDEIKARIVELAKEYATTGKRNDEERDKLSNMFVSSASPDRKGAITNALTSLGTQIKSLQTLSNTHTSMGVWIELLLGRALLNENFSLNHLDVHDSSGNLIASYNEHRGWRSVLTDAELSRARELAGLFRDTVAEANNGMQTPQSNGSTGVQIGNPTVGITGEVIEPPKVDVKM